MGTGSAAEAINATHKPLVEVTAGKMCPVWLCTAAHRDSGFQPVLTSAVCLLQLPLLFPSLSPREPLWVLWLSLIFWQRAAPS